MVTFAGPVVSDFGASGAVRVHVRSLASASDQPRYAIECALAGPDVTCAGTLWGGNLAMVAHLAARRTSRRSRAASCSSRTSGEVPYRVERMLYQLHHAGVLAAQRAIVLGRFTEYTLSANDGG